MLAYVVFSLQRMPSAIERVQADVFVPTDLAPMTPTFRRWRSAVTVEELSVNGRPLSRRQAQPGLVREFR